MRARFLTSEANPSSERRVHRWLLSVQSTLMRTNCPVCGLETLANKGWSSQKSETAAQGQAERPEAGAVLVVAENVFKIYRSGKILVPALRGVNLQVGRTRRAQSKFAPRKTVAFVVALLLSASGVVQHTVCALAFAPKNWISTVLSSIDGLVAVRFQTHQSITESAIRELDSEFFRKPKTTKSMEKALERIVEANAKVDDDQTQSALHFDGENFVEGQARLNLLSQNIVKSLQAGIGDIIRLLKNLDVGIARDSLGSALHTIQDFYAHSNWIELGNRAPHPDLGRPFGAIDQARSDEPTCVDCTGAPDCPICVDNLITKKLTSGYFGGIGKDRRLSALR